MTARDPDPLDRFPAFVGEVRERLEAGRAAYGDRSFERAPAALLAEIEQELFDVCAWSFILWERLRRMREACEVLAPAPLAVAPAEQAETTP